MGTRSPTNSRRCPDAPACSADDQQRVVDRQGEAHRDADLEREDRHLGACTLVGLEAVLLVDSNPGQLLPLPRQFVASPRQRVLGLKQLQPGRKPLFQVFRSCDRSLFSRHDGPARPPKVL
jgi:hypothetical protein